MRSRPEPLTAVVSRRSLFEHELGIVGDIALETARVSAQDAIGHQGAAGMGVRPRHEQGAGPGLRNPACARDIARDIAREHACGGLSELKPAIDDKIALQAGGVASQCARGHQGSAAIVIGTLQHEVSRPRLLQRSATG